jgi:hypothetical protein
VRVSAVLVCLAIAPAAASPRERTAKEFFVDRVGSDWLYHGSNGSDWHLKIADNRDGLDVEGDEAPKTWRLDNGAWTEVYDRHGSKPVVVLPAKLRVGTKWEWSYESLAHEDFTLAFEVTSVSEKLALDTGLKFSDCVVVKESGASPSGYRLHYFVAGRGEVAVQLLAGDERVWELALAKFVAPR